MGSNFSMDSLTHKDGLAGALHAGQSLVFGLPMNGDSSGAICKRMAPRRQSMSIMASPTLFSACAQQRHSAGKPF